MLFFLCVCVCVCVCAKLCPQTCVAPDYVLCHPEIQESLISQLKETLFDFYGEVSEQSSAFATQVTQFATLSHFLEGTA